MNSNLISYYDKYKTIDIFNRVFIKSFKEKFETRINNSPFKGKIFIHTTCYMSHVTITFIYDSLNFKTRNTFKAYLNLYLDLLLEARIKYNAYLLYKEYLLTI